jgi:hypothetical protein
MEKIILFGNNREKADPAVENFIKYFQKDSDNTFKKYSWVVYFIMVTHLSLFFNKSKVSKAFWLIGQLTWLPFYILLMSSFYFSHFQKLDSIEDEKFTIGMMTIMAISFILAQY